MMKKITVRKLQLAIEEQGGDWALLGRQISQLTSDLQKKTIYSDEATMRAMILAINTGANHQEVIKNISLIQDMAAGAACELGAMAEYVGCAMIGDTDGLARYIPGIRELNTKQRTWTNIQKIMTNHFRFQLKTQARIKVDWTPENIRNLREGLGITQVELAEMLDPRCSDSAVSRWEAGRSPVGKFYRKRLDAINKKAETEIPPFILSTPRRT